MGVSVTICLAASTINDLIVTVSDRRIAWGDDFGSGTPADDDGTLKTALIAKGWGIMFAGDDLRPVPTLLADIKQRLEPTKGNQTEIVVRAAVEASYRAAFEHRFVAERLSRYGFSSMDDFRRDGLAVFGPKLLAKFSTEIGEFNFGIDLLVYGFDRETHYAQAHIFLVENPGVVHDCDILGYGILGTGTDAALSTLLRKPFKRPTLTDAIWRLCEAKFSAEMAYAVGKKTNIWILGEDGIPESVSPAIMKALREVWDNEQRAGTPPEAVAVIKRGLSWRISEIEKGGKST
jgi:hypothetical protein